MYVSKNGEGRWKMKKNFWVLLLFIVIGLLAGALIARSLTTVPGLSFLTKSTPIVWSPAADLLVLSYSLRLAARCQPAQHRRACARHLAVPQTVGSRYDAQRSFALMEFSRVTLTQHPSQLVLASSSPRRRELVASLGLSLPVLILSSDADETTPPDWTPPQIVERLGSRKAMASAELLSPEDASTSLVIGADTIVVLGGEALGKPRDRADAVGMLSRLQGRRHEVFTGIACFEAANRSVTYRAPQNGSRDETA